MGFITFKSVFSTVVTARLEDLHMALTTDKSGHESYEVFHGPTGNSWYVSRDTYQMLAKLMTGGDE